MGDCSAMGVRKHREYGAIRIRGRWLAVLTVLGFVGVPAAAAQADDTWTGQGTTSSWSNTLNWTAGVPAATAGTLTFPTLTGCASPKTCYTSKNTLTGITATGLVFADTSGSYKIQGNALTI